VHTLITLLQTPWLGTPAGFWLAFAAIVASLLALDLGLLHREEREIGVRESLWLSAGYISVAGLFGLGLSWQLGAQRGTEFFTGFLIEKSLSLDNVFVIALVFGATAIPRALQHRVLFWGILGAIAMRALLIGVGATLIERFAWLLPLFGVFLVVTGLRMLRAHGREAHAGGPDIGQRTIAWLRRRLPVTPDLHGKAFVVRLPVTDADGAPAGAGRWRRFATPLLLALCAVEAADLVFALDSVPAIFAITTDPFIVLTSNIFALLGLRALYFALAAMLHRFDALAPALAAVLVFIGGKIVLAPWLGHGPAWVSLAVTVGLLAGGVGVSLWRRRGAHPAQRSRATSSAETAAPG